MIVEGRWFMSLVGKGAGSFLAACLLWFLGLGSTEAMTKVAVIGDSISVGSGAENPRQQGYAAQMAALLGDKYDVEVFALGGHTLLQKTSASLMKKPIYQKALQFAPDVAVVMLGTNDSSSGRRPFWRYHEDLRPDLLSMISDLRQANPEILVHVAGPPPMYPDRSGLKEERVADLTQRREHLKVVRSVFRQVAEEEPNVIAHDLSRALSPEETTDGVHPTTAGHKRLGNHMAELLRAAFDEGFSIQQKLPDPKVGEFHGFQRYDFALDEVATTVVVPRQARQGRPWIWRARFFGHQPALDLQLLDRGWHFVYCDVKNLYGSDEAMTRWDRCHRFMTKSGLSSKPVLEGMSRGGLPIFRWASLNPDKVSAVYGDNPVCDFRTWPGGEGSKGSPGDWKRLLEAWEISEEEGREHPQVVDWLEPMAKAGLPVALVLGLKDEVVPPVTNGMEVAEKYQELGGPVKVWTKPEDGHHPHGLHPPDELRQFLVEAAGY